MILSSSQLKEWNYLTEQIIRYYYDYHINSFFLQDGQSLPILLSPDVAACSSVIERMQGLVVRPNEEAGFWACEEALEKKYPNPYLVKLVRKVFEVCPDALLCSNGSKGSVNSSLAYWNRSEAILQCGILPICSDFLTTLCKYCNIAVAKNGTIEAIVPDEKDPMDDLAFFSHLTSSIVNGVRYYIHYICNESSPYPTMTLKRATWPAVCLLYTLPSMTLCYYKEDEGRCIKITQGDEYTITSTSYSSVENDPVEVMELPRTNQFEFEPHYGAQLRKKGLFPHPFSFSHSFLLHNRSSCSCGVYCWEFQ